MGCISSKVLTRSMSIQEELNQSLQRRTNGVPVLEQLFTSTNGNNQHQLVTLICNANKASNELRTGSFTLLPKTGPKPPPEPTNTEVAINGELMAGLEKQAVQPAESLLLSPPKTVGTSDVNISRRSKSFHRIDGLKEDEYNWDNKDIARSRSFHTVEEFDALLEKIQKGLSSTANEIGLEDYCDSVTKLQLQHANASFENSHHAKHNDLATDQSVLWDEDSIREKTEVSRIPLTSEPESKESLPSLDSNSLAEKMDSVEDGDAQEGNISRKGLKRKAVAEGLSSLEIPSTIELPTIGSLREWLQDGGQVFTPKFGSPVSSEDCDEDSVFNPELVAAFEECMQQLEVEEESIIKQIEGSLMVVDSKEREAEEGISS